MDKIEQIRRAHGQARPKTDNPAWLNCHHDCRVLLEEIEQQEARFNYIATHLPPSLMTEIWNHLNAEFDRSVWDTDSGGKK